jgi:hypothetical protein
MRTYSHWKERRRGGFEELDFAEALAAEDSRVGDVEERLRREAGFHSYAHEQQSYARQSEYAPALERWVAHYPREQFLIVSSEDYYATPQATLAEAQRFLGLPVRTLASGEVRNAAAGESIAPDVAERLAARFAPHNAALAEMTGQTFAWRTPAG